MAKNVSNSEARDFESDSLLDCESVLTNSLRYRTPISGRGYNMEGTRSIYGGGLDESP